MRTFLWLLILCCMPGILPADRVALVIGNSNYESVPELPNPVNDSKSIADELERQGFAVLRRDDLNQLDMRRVLREFRTRADSAEIAMIYYAGHGIEVSGENFLVPVDARLEDERDASVELINLSVLLRQISGAEALKMIVLDACRNNPFITKLKREDLGRNVGRGLADVKVSDSDTLIAYAAAAGEITPDGISGGNSPFTAAFVKAMQGPPRDVRTLLGVVRDEMRQSVPGAAPFVYSSLGGRELVINPNSVAPAAAAPQPPVPAPAARGPTAQELEQVQTLEMISDFVAAGATENRAVWEAFLLKYADRSDHMLYGVALKNLEALTPAVPAAVAAAPTASAPEAPTTRAPEVGASSPTPAPPAPEATAPVEMAALPDEEPRGLRVAPTSLVDEAALQTDVEPEPALNAPPALSPEESEAKMTRAMFRLQTMLADRNCYSAAIDGLYGRRTAGAISDFAKAAKVTLDVGSPPSLKELQAAIGHMEQAEGVSCPKATTARSGNPTSTKRTKRTRPSKSRECAHFNGIVICK